MRTVWDNKKQGSILNMKKFRYRPFIAALLAGMTCGSAWAADYPSEQDYLQELPIVLSASRLSQPISEAPNAMTVIDRNMIVASGVRNIADVFKLVPGMYVGYVNGHTPIVSYRGITDQYARRMQVLVDGRSIYLPILGQVDWAELPLDIGDIDRIEVIRGPSAASHGSNSVQGVISIFTRHASGAHKPEVSARLGDAGISDISARFGGAGESWDYRVTLASRGDNGFDPIPIPNKVPLNDTSRTQLINTRINYRPTGSDSLDIQLGYSNSLRGLGDIKPLTPSANTTRDQKTGSDSEQLTWLHTLNANSDLQFSYYHIGRNVKDDRYTGAAPLPALTDAVIHRHDLEIQHTLHTSPVNRIVWGVGARQDSANAPANLKYSPTWREYRLFAHDEWRINQAGLINTGAMVEKNAQGKAYVSPRVSYNHHLTQQDTLRASVSVAYRNPEMVEELGKTPTNSMLAAGGLSPEKTISREVGYIRQLNEAGSMLDIRAYHDQINNIIWVDPSNTKSFTSDFDVHYSGLESTLKYKMGARSNLTVNYAHQITRATPAHTPPLASKQAILNTFVQKYAKTVPLHSGSVLFSHDFSDGLQFGAGFYQIGPIQLLETPSIVNAQPLTRYLDLRIAQRFGGWQSKKERSGGGEIALVIQNALSDHYYDYSVETRNKRRAYITATLGF
ncbi:MAG TPA: TonB-dependent receptor [Gallionella sp.]|nr:TonB-dependent receptor [Gallionella sp.]